MAMKVSKKELQGWRAKAQRLQKRLKNASKKADRVVETMVHTAEVSSAAFIAGVVQGKTGGVEVLGVPMDLGLAAGLHVLAFAGVGGRMSSHLHGFGDGFLAAFLATTGRGVGQAWAAKAAATKTKSSGVGHLPAYSGDDYLDMGDRELAAMAAAL